METAELDSFILGQLNTTPQPASSLTACFTRAYPAYDGNTSAYRIIDRSLQRLRKAGKIQPAPKQKGWVLA